MFEEPNKSTLNMRFIRTGDDEYKTEKVTKEELEKLRAGSRKEGWMGLGRSCWECNRAHVHHIGKGNYNCFSCGRYYRDAVDITDYSGSDLEEYATANLLTPQPLEEKN